MTSDINPEAALAFMKNSVAARLVVREVKNMEAALDLALEVTAKKEKAPNLLLGSPTGESPGGLSPVGDMKSLDPSCGRKTLFIDGVSGELYRKYFEKGERMGFHVFRENAALFGGGIDAAFSVASLGIAATATCVLESYPEEGRAASELCEIHVIALPKSKIVTSLYETESFLEEALGRNGNYISFITGPSRTSDIERVLALGVHGPLELYAALVDE
jgi:L-lactate dehydrogenase complex protein LldG